MKENIYNCKKVELKNYLTTNKDKISIDLFNRKDTIVSLDIDESYLDLSFETIRIIFQLEVLDYKNQYCFLYSSSNYSNINSKKAVVVKEHFIPFTLEMEQINKNLSKNVYQSSFLWEVNKNSFCNIKEYLQKIILDKKRLEDNRFLFLGDVEGDTKNVSKFDMFTFYETQEYFKKSIYKLDNFVNFTRYYFDLSDYKIKYKKAFYFLFYPNKKKEMETMYNKIENLDDKLNIVYFNSKYTDRIYVSAFFIEELQEKNFLNYYNKTSYVNSIKNKNNIIVNYEIQYKKYNDSFDTDISLPDHNQPLIYIVHFPESKVIKVGRSKNWASRESLYNYYDSNFSENEIRKLVYFQYTNDKYNNDSYINELRYRGAEKLLKQYSKNILNDTTIGVEYFEYIDSFDINSFIIDFNKLWQKNKDTENLLKIYGKNNLRKFSKENNLNYNKIKDDYNI